MSSCYVCGEDRAEVEAAGRSDCYCSLYVDEEQRNPGEYADEDHDLELADRRCDEEMGR
jgi:ferredoxin-thioredoxin reductase catalytic subunit